MSNTTLADIPGDLPPVVGIVIENVNQDLNVTNIWDESFIEQFRMKRAEVLNNWDRDSKILKIKQFISFHLDETPYNNEIAYMLPSTEPDDRNNSKNISNENCNLYQIYLYKTSLDDFDEFALSGTKSYISREQCEAFKTGITNRETEEINAVINALIDYEILALIFEKQKSIDDLNRYIILIAMEKIYYFVNLILFSKLAITSRELINIGSNLHVLNKNIFMESPTIKEAIVNYLIYLLNTVGHDCYTIKALLLMFRRFVYYLNRFQFSMLESKSKPATKSTLYEKNYANWLAACSMPKFTNSFPQYELCDTFGLEFLTCMLKYVRADFKPNIQNSEREVQEFFNRVETEFLDPTKPFWRKDFRNNLSQFDSILVKWQECLIDCVFDKNDSHSRVQNNRLNKEEFMTIFQFYEIVLTIYKPYFDHLIQSKDNDNDEDNDDDDNTDDEESEKEEKANRIQSITLNCQYCDKNKFIYCFVHNRFNNQPVDRLEGLKLLPNAFPSNWIRRCLITWNDCEMLHVTLTTDKFDPERINLLPDRSEYLFPVGDEKNQIYRIVINEKMLKNVKRPMFLKYLEEAKPRNQLNQNIYKIFLDLVRTKSLDEAKIQTIGYGLEKPQLNLDFRRFLYTYFVTEINFNMLSAVSSYLVGNSPANFPIYDTNSSQSFIQVTLLKNSFQNEWDQPMKNWLNNAQNVFIHQLPRMGKDYITRLMNDPRHMTLVLVKNGEKAVGGIHFRPYPEQGFSEIVFCAVSAKEQVKGYGTIMMNNLKDFHISQGIFWFLTYADAYAVGYFKKLGFSDKLTLPNEKYLGYIKDYDGAILMECRLEPRISYNGLKQALRLQKSIIENLMEIQIKSNRTKPYAFNFSAENRIIPINFVQKMFKNNIKINHNHIDFKDHCKELYQTLKSILLKLKSHPSSSPFLKPVDEKEMPLYYETIDYPMDLQEISERLNRNYYTNTYMFHCDMNRIFFNCRTFYGEDSENLIHANTFERYYLTFMKELGLLVKKQKDDDEGNKQEEE